MARDSTWSPPLHAQRKRRHSLADMQEQMKSFSKSQNDVFNALKESRDLSDEVDARLGDAERRLTLSTNAVSKMQAILAASRRNTFQEGGDEQAKWNKLRFNVVRSKTVKGRKDKLEADVEDVRKRLEQIGNSE